VRGRFVIFHVLMCIGGLGGKAGMGLYRITIREATTDSATGSRDGVLRIHVTLQKIIVRPRYSIDMLLHFLISLLFPQSSEGLYELPPSILWLE